ncbi:uncharacterized protein [Tiliqua scincoides]|uniref:uncharacterized protein n=1 Tax=Tiliqua scincoides TaxID=71010 RepID=UPI0034628D71
MNPSPTRANRTFATPSPALPRNRKACVCWANGWGGWRGARRPRQERPPRGTASPALQPPAGDKKGDTPCREAAQFGGKGAKPPTGTPETGGGGWRERLASPEGLDEAPTGPGALTARSLRDRRRVGKEAKRYEQARRVPARRPPSAAALSVSTGSYFCEARGGGSPNTRPHRRGEQRKGRDDAPAHTFLSPGILLIGKEERAGALRRRCTRRPLRREDGCGEGPFAAEISPPQFNGHNSDANGPSGASALRKGKGTWKLRLVTPSTRRERFDLLPTAPGTPLPTSSEKQAASPRTLAVPRRSSALSPALPGGPSRRTPRPREERAASAGRSPRRARRARERERQSGSTRHLTGRCRAQVRCQVPALCAPLPSASFPRPQPSGYTSRLCA